MNSCRKVLVLPAAVLATLALLGCTGVLPLGVLAVLAVPLPAAYVHMRQGTLAGGGVMFATAGVLAWLVGLHDALVYLGQYGLLSFLLALQLRRGVAWDRAVGMTLAFLLPAGGLVLAGLSMTGGLNVPAVVDNYLQNETRQALALIQQANLDPEQANRLEALIGQTAQVLQQVWPAVTVIGLAALLLATLFGLHLLSRGRYVLPGMPAHLWKMPEMLIWGLIATGGAVVVSSGMVEFAALNGLLIVLAGYFFQGLAIVCHYFRKNSVPPVLRTLGYVLVVTLNPLPVIVTGLGVFDLWVDFRKPRKIKD